MLPRQIINVFCVVILALLCCNAVYTTAQQDNVLFFNLGYAPVGTTKTATIITGSLTCNQPVCSNMTNSFTINVQATIEEAKVNPEHITMSVYDSRGVSLGETDHTVKRDVEVHFPETGAQHRLNRDVVQGETVYFTAQLSWYKTSGDNTNANVRVTMGYGDFAAGITNKVTKVQPFYPLTEIKTTYQGERFWDENTHELDVKLYVKTPDYDVSSFVIKPFGAIFIHDEASLVCYINSLPVDVAIAYDDDDAHKIAPTLTLTVAKEHKARYSHWQALNDVEIECDAGLSARRLHKWGGWSVLAKNAAQPDEAHMITLQMTNFQRSHRSQTDAMALYDATVIPDALHHYEYLTRIVTEKFESIVYSYNSVDFLLYANADHDFSKKKDYLFRINNLHGGAITLIRYALTPQDKNGDWMPYSSTGKMSIDYYTDGRYAECEAFSPTLPSHVVKTMDKSKPVKLTITYILQFKSHPPTSVVSTSMLGIRQTVHFTSLLDKQVLSYFSFASPATQKKAFVTDSDFKLNIEDVEFDKNTLDYKTKAKMSLTAPDSDITVVPQHGFNFSIANIQYNDGERPEVFNLRIPTGEYNFGGNTNNCTINDKPITVVDTYDPEVELDYINDKTISFKYLLNPATNYKLKCPYIFLSNTTAANDDHKHGDKDVLVQFIALSPNPENDYFLVGAQIAGFHHDDHDDGVKFSIVVLLFLGLSFAACVAYIIYQTRYNKTANDEGNVELKNFSGENPNSSGDHHQSNTQYSHYNDVEKH